MRGWLKMVVATLVVIVVLLVLKALLAPDPSVRNYEFLPDMAYSPAAESLTLSTVLPGGKTQQPLVPGVVTREAEFFPYGTGTEEAARAGRELKNPFSLKDEEAVTRGAWAYAVYCDHCHGADGSGNGTAVKRGMIPPPSLLGARSRTIKDGEIFHIVTRGQNNMASHAAQIPPEDRWKIILHIRKLQGAAK